ncbi:MAG TPA: hypothetical protein VMF88_11050 [Bacteroidota bacterium]|nr:hypothetical protein [Bacteroidota bacterium]
MRTIPFESIAISIAVEQRKLIKRLHERILHLEEQAAALQSR